MKLMVKYLVNLISIYIIRRVLKDNIRSYRICFADAQLGSGCVADVSIQRGRLLVGTSLATSALLFVCHGHKMAMLDRHGIHGT